MKVHLPNSAFLGNISSFLSRLDLSEPEKLEISTNPKWVWVHPLVISMTAALGKLVKPENIICGEILSPSGYYLKRMGLFDFIGIEPKIKSITEHESAGRFIPLTQINNSGDLDRFLKELVPLLHLEGETKRVQAIQHIFSELIRNALEHSGSPNGAMVCAQYFKKTNRIAIGVADNGIGLKNSINRSYSAKNDLEAIKLALTPGITGTTRKPGGTAQNAGFGLFLIKSIAYSSSDYFNIISGDKMFKLQQRGTKPVKLQANPFDDRHLIMNTPQWKGVAIGVDISLDQTDEFTSLLDVIYKFYAKDVNGQKKEKYKKPKFI